MLIWTIPAIVAALALVKLGALFVWVQVMSVVIKALALACVLLLAGVIACSWRRVRSHRHL